MAYDHGNRGGNNADGGGKAAVTFSRSWYRGRLALKQDVSPFELLLLVDPLTLGPNSDPSQMLLGL
ncbi:hypothetical protein A2U01_0079659, partial [Trifolium medium]|nr:hypothetical protein [Trifolium medium]